MILFVLFYLILDNNKKRLKLANFPTYQALNTFLHFQNDLDQSIPLHFHHKKQSTG